MYRSLSGWCRLCRGGVKSLLLSFLFQIVVLVATQDVGTRGGGESERSKDVSDLDLAGAAATATTVVS